MGTDSCQFSNGRPEGSEVSRFYLKLGPTGMLGNYALGLITWDGEVLSAYWEGWDFMERGLAKFERLPAERRKPGRIKDLQVDPRNVMPHPPAGALVLNEFFHGYEKDASGNWSSVVDGGGVGGMREPFRDYLWILEGEWKSLIGSAARKGAAFDVAPVLAERFFRLHMFSAAGEVIFPRGALKRQALKATVEHRDGEKGRLRLEGTARLEDARRSVECALLGFVEFDPGKALITRFDVVAHSRQGADSPTLCGYAFELARPGTFEYQVVPGALNRSGNQMGTAEQYFTNQLY